MKEWQFTWDRGSLTQKDLVKYNRDNLSELQDLEKEVENYISALDKECVDLLSGGLTPLGERPIRVVNHERQSQLLKTIEEANRDLSQILTRLDVIQRRK